jgi:hypothetical protein
VTGEDGSARAFRSGDETGVHPDGERLPDLVGSGLHGVSLRFGDADAEDLGPRVVERRSAASFRLTHAPENIRPRKVLTEAGFMGHNKGMTTSQIFLLVETSQGATVAVRFPNRGALDAWEDEHCDEIEARGVVTVVSPAEAVRLSR